MDCAAPLSLRNESRHCPIRGWVMPAQNALRIGCPHGATHFQPDGSRSLQTGWGASRARSCREVMRGLPFSGPSWKRRDKSPAQGVRWVGLRFVPRALEGGRQA